MIHLTAVLEDRPNSCAIKDNYISENDFSALKLDNEIAAFVSFLNDD